MTPTAAYDEIADWYEEEFLGGRQAGGGQPAVVIAPGYLDGHWAKASWTDQGVRAKVGATHRPLPELLHAFVEAGLTLERSPRAAPDPDRPGCQGAEAGE